MMQDNYKYGGTLLPFDHCNATMNMSARSLSSGLYGFETRIPAGSIVDNASDNNKDMCLRIHNEEQNIRWSLKFFENLHMDLSQSTREHLHQEIERIGRAIFTEKYGRNVVPDSQQDAMDVDDENDQQQQQQQECPIIDLEYQNVPASDGSGTRTTTQSLIVVHKVTRYPGEHTVMGRFFLPVRRGLFEVIAIAETPRIGCEAAPAVIIPDDQYDDLEVEYMSTTPTMIQYNNSLLLEQLQQDCLDRVRSAMSWLLTESSLIVTDPAPLHVDNEVEVRQLRCKLVLPPRFVYSPNPSSPESNKHRFCRASFGGSDGVQAMVVSCWYGRHIKKGMKGLRQVALHGAKVIHESQNFSNIRITTKEVRLNHHHKTSSSSSRRRGRSWLNVVAGGGGSSSSGSKDAIITTVNCEEGYGHDRQNTIGWIREKNSGIVFLVYFIDTMELDAEQVQTEILDTLSSIRVPRLLNPRSYAWNMILHKSGAAAAQKQGTLLTTTATTTTTAPTTISPTTYRTRTTTTTTTSKRRSNPQWI